MALLFVTKYAGYYYDPEHWRRELTRMIPGLDFRIWPEVGNPKDILLAVADHAPPGLLPTLSNLRCVLYPGYGPDAVVRAPDLPAHVPLARLEDPGVARQMTEYVVLYVLHHHRRARAYETQAASGRWALVAGETPTDDTTVGFLGLGRLGATFADALGYFGFRRLAWTRTPKSMGGVECVHGAAALLPMLARADIVVASLPSTPATRDLLQARTLAAFKPGAYLINVGRGDLIVEADLLAALDSGRLAGATLDVHRPSPLPPDNPLWRHPKVIVSPHSSGAKMTDALPEVAAVYRKVVAGGLVPNLIDRAQGY
ncbi:MAG: glyoxylate/hydroxypyruvate reductase A [Alphaproteobacteria bacterium]|nr:glyoxylate/hydroxypyruvate reductase A [Alphaproteobacteria bacterium]